MPESRAAASRHGVRGDVDSAGLFKVRKSKYFTRGPEPPTGRRRQGLHHRWGARGRVSSALARKQKKVALYELGEVRVGARERRETVQVLCDQAVPARPQVPAMASTKVDQHFTCGEGVHKYPAIAA